jgi:pyridoxamine 5'-phosphate oxidase
VSNPFLAERLPVELPDEPFAWLEAWLDLATTRQVQRNPNSMTLVTASPDARPAGRVVLAKALDTQSGFVVFYTNYQSRKGQEIDANPRVAAVFHWDSMGRQVRLEGRAVRSPAAESDAYFASRDRGSQIGAWGSDQSRPLESRDALVTQIAARAEDLGVSEDNDKTIPRPPHWGGYRLWASAIELWIEGGDRVHDRARWERGLEPCDDFSFSTTPWKGTRLQP